MSNKRFLLEGYKVADGFPSSGDPVYPRFVVNQEKQIMQTGKQILVKPTLTTITDVTDVNVSYSKKIVKYHSHFKKSQPANYKNSNKYATKSSLGSTTIRYTGKEKAFLEALRTERASNRQNECKIEASIEEVKLEGERMTEDIDKLQDKIDALHTSVYQKIVRGNETLAKLDVQQEASGAHTAPNSYLEHFSHHNKERMGQNDGNATDTQDRILDVQVNRVKALTVLKFEKQKIESHKLRVEEEIAETINVLKGELDCISLTNHTNMEIRNNFIKEKVRDAVEISSVAPMTSSDEEIQVEADQEGNERSKYLLETDIKTLMDDKRQKHIEAKQVSQGVVKKKMEQNERGQESLREATRQQYDKHLSIRRETGESISKTDVWGNIQTKQTQQFNFPSDDINKGKQREKWSRLQKEYDNHAKKLEKRSRKTKKPRNIHTFKKRYIGRRKRLDRKVGKRRGGRSIASCVNSCSSHIRGLNVGQSLKNKKTLMRQQIQNISRNVGKLPLVVSSKCQKPMHRIATTSKSVYAGLTSSSKTAKSVVVTAAANLKSKLALVLETVKQSFNQLTDVQSQRINHVHLIYRRKMRQIMNKKPKTSKRRLGFIGKLVFVLNYNNALLSDTTKGVEVRNDYDGLNDMKIYVMYGKNRRKDVIKEIEEEYDDWIQKGRKKKDIDTKLPKINQTILKPKPKSESKRYPYPRSKEERRTLQDERKQQAKEERMVQDQKKKAAKILKQEENEQKKKLQALTKKPDFQVYEPYEYQLGRKLEKKEIFTIFMDRMKLKHYKMTAYRDDDSSEESDIEVARVVESSDESMIMSDDMEAAAKFKSKTKKSETGFHKRLKSSSIARRFLKWENLPLIDDFDEGRTDMVYEFMEKDTVLQKVRQIHAFFSKMDFHQMDNRDLIDLLMRLQELNIPDDPEAKAIVDNLKKRDIDKLSRSEALKVLAEFKDLF